MDSNDELKEIDIKNHHKNVDITCIIFFLD